MPDPLVTVTAYSAGEDARAAKGVLDSAGIDAVVDDARAQRARVRVEPVQALRAGDVLNAQPRASSEIDEPDEEEGERLCPACDGRHITPSQRARTFVLVAVMTIAVAVGVGVAEAAFFVLAAAGVFLLIGGRWRCGDCGEAFD